MTSIRFDTHSLTLSLTLTLTLALTLSLSPLSLSRTPMGDTFSTNFSSWLFAVPGSPSSSKLMSPRRTSPSGNLKKERAVSNQKSKKWANFFISLGIKMPAQDDWVCSFHSSSYGRKPTLKHHQVSGSCGERFSEIDKRAQPYNVSYIEDESKKSAMTKWNLLFHLANQSLQMSQNIPFPGSTEEKASNRPLDVCTNPKSQSDQQWAEPLAITGRRWTPPTEICPTISNQPS